MKLLDSTFLVHYLRGEDAVADYLAAHEDEELVTTSVDLKEIAVGEHLIGDPTREELLADFRWLRIVPFDANHAYVAGKLEATLRDDPGINRDGINALAGDLLIAAVARDLGATVVTRNPADFERFEGVAVETY
ncbi:type II toxin-antitoxin system VapC family toxin [Halomarina pelagica]|uniref:type II toxin-antitoxin system VapC family toxin n=1 Tax=Halomarina pelagica TaxID=2961599 RepID=UPI0020C3E256|nr:type II toxin-antitoxin system VapC family toxin [Halomarina sp. BND7]